MVVDYFGADTSTLKQKKLFLFDMDGTIYEEERLFDGALDLLNTIRRSGGRYVFITNNSSKSVDDYLAKVRRMGIQADEENFFTSAQAAVLLLKERHPGQTVYCQGTVSLLQELQNAGIAVTNHVSDDAGVILVGFDTELTSEKLRNTCEMLTRDLPYYATNPDLACPVSFGFIPDCGSICMMLENASGKKPVYIGKPQSTMVDIVRQKYGYSREETLVIGDRLYTDIATGIHAGVDTVCVLTGEATVPAIQQGDFPPTYTFPSVWELWEAVCQA